METMKRISNLVPLVLKAVALAMGVAVVVLNTLGAADARAMFTLIGIGLFGLGLAALDEDRSDERD